MKKLFVSLSGLLLASSVSQAAISLTNGDFETGGGNNINNVSGWNDHNSANFWEGAWQTNASAITPNGSNVVVFSSFDNSASGNFTASANPLSGSYLYQAIGTAEGATAATVGFDFGAPNDAPPGLGLGMTVAIYAYDGLGTFVAGDNVNPFTASQTAGSGVTLLDSNSSFTATSTGIDGQISAYQTTLSLAAAGSQQLYLSFSNYRPVNTEGWPVLDNVTIAAVPEPSAAWLGGLGILALLRRRR